MRPLPVTVTTSMMCITNFMGFFLLNLSYPHMLALLVIYAIFIAIGYVALWFFWKGHNWARWLVLATSLLCLFNLKQLRDPIPAWYNFHVGFTMIILEAAIAIYLLYYLNTGPARAWFTQRPPMNRSSLID
jgi:hypothetical protein